jgi:predicted nucleotidyltransferase component of viral defense system
MDERFNLKYRRVLEILPDVAECAAGKLILVGGTALAVFHLEHRISIDLDFVPISGSDTELKEALKGCLTKKGYRTLRSAYPNQFVIQFEDTSIKIEVFSPVRKIKHWKEHEFGKSKLHVATMDEILKMKMDAYADRREARDLFDLVFILSDKKEGMEPVAELIRKHGPPKNSEDIRNVVLNDEDYATFIKVISDASKAGG